MSDFRSFIGVRIQGGLLPADLLSRLSTARDLDGLASTDYHLAAGESVREGANRVWAYLRGVWAAYREALENLPQGDRATSLTRERWLLILLDQFGYGRVPTGPTGGVRVHEKAHPVSHLWQQVPIHLLGAGIDLDRRTPGVAGAAGASPQSMVQELLNSSDDSLWAILSNGRTLRLLRDSTSLVGSAYIEFDLEAIFDGDLFSDFLLLYTLCHQSRVEVRDAELGPKSCWLEVWRDAAIESGTRALNQLRDGVVEALEALGSGFLTHPDNAGLRNQLDTAQLSTLDVHHSLLRVVYRLLFTFVAEDRGALLDPNATVLAKERYLAYFSTDRLRRTARRRRGGRQGDKWRALGLVWDGLGSPQGRAELGIVGIGGLFEQGQLDILGSCELSNESLLRAVRALSIIREPKSGFKRVVDHRNLGAEELGSIYESLLEYLPTWDPATKKYKLALAAGNARKTSGSYYTPTSLIDRLLDSALDPVLDQAQKNAENPEQALLSVTVCDPACGSGHFLVGAARRIAKRVAGVRTGDPEPPPERIREAMRDVVARCIYGVDINPLAAELAKVSLWLEAIEPGMPLAFLDAQIKVGNALIGATPSLLAQGVPDEAFRPIEGDDKKVAAALAKQNRSERVGQGSLLDTPEISLDNSELVASARGLLGASALSLTDVHVQQQRLNTYVDSPAYKRAREIADAWCAAFVWRKTLDAANPVTHGTVINLDEEPELVLHETREEIERLAGEYRFFHWHLEFPHVFPTKAGDDDSVNPATGWAGGFDVVVGNPPWERVKLQEQEFFASRDPEIALAPNAAVRKRLIDQLLTTNPTAHATFIAARRRAEGESHLLRSSGRYPFTGRGDINTYAVFAEADRNLLSSHGRLGVVVPTGIATDATTQYFFKDLVESQALASLYDFENRKPLFEGVDSRSKFSLLSLSGREVREPVADFAFFVHDPANLDRPSVRFGLTPEEIKLLNPNTGTCPVFRSRRDAEITLGIYRRVPVLINESDPVSGNPWGIRFMTMFHMSNDAHLFHTRQELEADGWTLDGNIFKREAKEMLPLYEAKMLGQFDHRDADVVKSATAAKRQNQPRYLTELEHADPARSAIPLAWVSADRLPKLPHEWLTGFSDVTSSTNERTVLAAALPRAAVGHTYPLYFAQDSGFLLAIFNSFCLDFVARQKVAGLHLTYGYVKQFAIPGPARARQAAPWKANEVLRSWIDSRVLELSYTAWDMRAFARTLGYDGDPFIWNRARRAHLRAELDAAFFHLYGIERNDVNYIMDTFTIVKRKDMATSGEYRTKRMILEVYDAMAEAIRTGVPYERR